MEIGLQHYLVVSSLLFACGVIAMLSRKNIIGILMGVELILNAAGINFAAFSKYVTGDLQGQAFSIFIILIAAAEAAVALAIVLRTFQNFKTIQVDDVALLKH